LGFGFGLIVLSIDLAPGGSGGDSKFRRGWRRKQKNVA
jgi:hypothetical protein